VPSGNLRAKGGRAAYRQPGVRIPAVTLTTLDRAKRTSRRRFLEDELSLLLDAVPSPRDRDVVRRILGWDGRGGCAIKEAGDEFSITRERARQVYTRAVELIRNRPPGALLDRVLHFVHTMCNQSAEAIEVELERRGLTRHRFALQALVQTALVFRRRPRFTLEEAGGHFFAVAGPGVVRAILKAVQRGSTYYGVQTVSELCSALPPRHRRSRDSVLIHQMLETRSDTCWLDADQEWFWLATVPRNPIVRCVRKLLAFASPASIADLDRAIRRLPRQPKTSVPREVIIRLCRQAPFCRVRGGLVELDPAFRPANLISHAEAVVCRILRRHGGELSFERLRASCASAGVMPPNLWRIVLHSPLLFRSAPGMYRLIAPSRTRQN